MLAGILLRHPVFFGIITIAICFFIRRAGAECRGRRGSDDVEPRQTIAGAVSDTDAARRMQQAKSKLFDAEHAESINSFYREYLNPYLNYHRPCAQADVEIDDKGHKRVRYRLHITMRLTVLQQQNKALNEERPQTGAGVSKQLESVKHLFGMGIPTPSSSRLT
jgi:hypothetical protein